MITIKIDPDKIREVIGKGGSVIQKITAESGAQVDIEDDGTIHIAAATLPPATPPRSASTISCSSPRSASCTTAAWCA